MMTPREIIEAFPTKAAFGRACGFTKYPERNAWHMHNRNRIPVKYWRSIVAEARGIGRKDITMLALAEAHSPPAEDAE